MKGLLGFIGSLVASSIVWMVVAPLMGATAAFLLSTIAGGFGMYYAIKWGRNSGL